MKIYNHALRQDIGRLLELDLLSEKVYTSSVGGFSIEVQTTPTSITSYTYKDEEMRSNDYGYLMMILFE